MLTFAELLLHVCRVYVPAFCSACASAPSAASGESDMATGCVGSYEVPQAVAMVTKLARRQRWMRLGRDASLLTAPSQLGFTFLSPLARCGKVVNACALCRSHAVFAATQEEVCTSKARSMKASCVQVPLITRHQKTREGHRLVRRQASSVQCLPCRPDCLQHCDRQPAAAARPAHSYAAWPRAEPSRRTMLACRRRTAASAAASGVDAPVEDGLAVQGLAGGVFSALGLSFIQYFFFFERRKDEGLAMGGYRRCTCQCAVKRSS